jgi:hypothetical protein
MLLQSVSSQYRCVWCGADVRSKLIDGAHTVTAEMVTLSDKVRVQLFAFHHQIANGDSRICKVCHSLYITSHRASVTWVKVG